MNYVETANETILSSDHGENLAQPLRVSQLVAILKRDVEEKHRFVRVMGELSSFKQWRSGHCYFDIKDEEALLPAVMFKPHFARLPFAVTDGIKMLFSGRVSIYAANARLQMIVESMEPLGQGALALAFEQLKERLKDEGLFDAQHKKPIKSFNQCVGLITSSHGAVIRDMVRILKSRMPLVDILFVPVRVQGAGAILEIKNAIELLDGLGVCDVIIVGRGGGSLEDLWAFNEELVARAIFKAKTPIISAVGHETDTTISDFVADVRAATPTHAATLAVPKLTDIETELSNAKQGLRLRHQANLRRFLLDLAKEKRRLKDPRVVLFRHWQRLDDMQKRIEQTMSRRVRLHKSHLNGVNKSLQQLAPWRQLRLRRETVLAAKAALLCQHPSKSLQRAISQITDRKKALHEILLARLNGSWQEYWKNLSKLEALSPLSVLSRGYSVVEDANKTTILSKRGQFTVDQVIHIRLEDGMITAVVARID